MKERKKRGVRSKRRQNRKKEILLKIMKYVIGYSLVFVIGYMGYGIYQEMRVCTIEQGQYESSRMKQAYLENIANGNNKNKQEINKQDSKNGDKSQDKKLDFVSVIEEYKGYEVDCRLEIPKIDLNTNVLKDYTKAGLKVCASKYYGPNPNEIGNYCIAGHNYKKKNMFYRLIELEIGDHIFLTDNFNGKIEYTIYDIYKVKPENVEPLSQETRGEKEVTLVTCVNYSTRRLVVKAIEV